MKTRIALGLVASLILPGTAFSQALVEYGTNAARAATAGAGAGAGIGGVFVSIKGTTDDGAKSRKQAAPASLKSDDTKKDDASTTPQKITTSNGIVVSGLPPTWMGGGYTPSAKGPVSVQDIEWSNPVAEQEAALVASSDPTQIPVPSGSGEQEIITTPSGLKIRPPAPVYRSRASRTGQALNDSETGTAQDQAAEAAPAVQTDFEIVGVAIGDDIETVFQRLGKPSFALTGLAGKGYTEKYIFNRPDGSRITVLAWHGKVTSVLVG